MFIFYLLGVGLLAVLFSVSSGCARRRSVSTYASILVHDLSFYKQLHVGTTPPSSDRETEAQLIPPKSRRLGFRLSTFPPGQCPRKKTVGAVSGEAGLPLKTS